MYIFRIALDQHHIERFQEPSIESQLDRQKAVLNDSRTLAIGTAVLKNYPRSQAFTKRHNYQVNCHIIVQQC